MRKPVSACMYVLAASLMPAALGCAKAAESTPTAAECVRFEQESFGALHQMLSGVDDQERAAAWREIEEALSEFETADGFVGPCEMLVVSGTRP